MRTILVLLMVLCGSMTTYGEEAPTPPNIILMLSDDQGWAGLSTAMHPDLAWSRSSVIETPNLERLASQGMRFSAAYAPASVCAPTRISLQTGRSPAALHWTKAAGREAGHRLLEPQNIREIDSRSVTIAELLREAGYATAHFGKWHINGGGPEANGYDVSDGDIGNEYAHQYADPNPADIFGMADRAAAFMKRCQQKQKPFFMQMSWHALHAPQNAMKETLAKYAARLKSSVEDKRVGTAALAENLDTAVGRVLGSLDELKLSDRTFVIYMSDNGSGGGGGQGSKGNKGGKQQRLAGGKGSVWEGGIRCPFMIRGPGIPANSWCHTRIVGYDLYPTFSEWAGVSAKKLPANLEGGSITGLLKEGRGDVARPTPELVFHFPHYQSGDGPHSALLLDEYKLLKFYEDDRLALFDIDADITEQNDLAQQMPQKVRELDGLLSKYLRDVDAQMAVPNPDYDPVQEPGKRERGRGGAKKPGKPNRPAKRGKKQ